MIQHYKFKPPEESDFFTEYNKNVGTVKIPAIGEYVYTSEGDSILLENIIGKGAEGTIYEVEGDLAVKVYNEKRLSVGRQEKIMLMVSKGVYIDGVTLPIEAVYNDSNILIGYIMNKAKGINLVELFKPKDVFNQLYPDYKKIDIVELAISVLENINKLHDLNIVLVDINLFNVMFNNNKETYIIDTDSFQVEGYPGLLARKEFFPLEVRYTDYRKKLKSFEYDYYTVAVLLFYILMNGVHPYLSIGNNIQENRDKGYFPYRVDSNESMTNVPNEDTISTWNALPRPIKEVFFNTFNKDGKRYHPKNRASVKLLLKHLYKYKSGLIDGTLEAIMGSCALKVFPG